MICIPIFLFDVLRGRLCWQAVPKAAAAPSGLSFPFVYRLILAKSAGNCNGASGIFSVPAEWAFPGDGRASLVLHFPVPLGLALVMKFLTFRQRDLKLNPAILQIQTGGNQGEPFLTRLSRQLFNFFPMQQQFPFSNRIVVFTISVRVLADVSVVQPSFPLADFRKTVLQLDLACLGRFDFGTRQNDSSFITVQEKILMAGVPIVVENANSRLSSTHTTMVILNSPA